MANFGLQAGCSRMSWAFARDRGTQLLSEVARAARVLTSSRLPASRYFDHISPRTQVPFRAMMLSVVIQVLLGLINIGSATAFNAFVNSAAVTLYITYS
nr:hypothetical protein B0A51_04773 [Rachicladosporium sp. CCFEE 5018]